MKRPVVQATRKTAPRKGVSKRLSTDTTYSSVEAVRNDLYPGAELPVKADDSLEAARRLGLEAAAELLMAVRQIVRTNKPHKEASTRAH